jgi:hypothetical protein
MASRARRSIKLGSDRSDRTATLADRDSGCRPGGSWLVRFVPDAWLSTWSRRSPVMKKAQFLGATLVLAGMAACGGGTDGGDGTGGSGGDGAGGAGGGTDTSAAALEACEEHSAAVCAKELECFEDRQKIIGPVAVCTERMTARCSSRFDLPGTGLTPQGLSACAAAMSAPGCGMFATVPAECKFTGTRATNQACADDAQCATGVCEGYFLPYYSGGCGVCAASAPSACLGGCDASKQGCGYPVPGPACGFGKICPGDQCVDGPKEGSGSCHDPFFACTYPATCQDNTCVLEVSTTCSAM